MNPICVKCRIEFRVKKNGVALVSMTAGNEPIELRRADLWACPQCGAQIVFGMADSPQFKGETVPVAIMLEELGGGEIIRYWMNEHERDLAKAKAENP